MRKEIGIYHYGRRMGMRGTVSVRGLLLTLVNMLDGSGWNSVFQLSPWMAFRDSAAAMLRSRNRFSIAESGWTVNVA